ncbi:hypothetical protein DA2_2827 [Desulfovibrio sp. A2]|nr:hypothetical protein DA2_2827 [Desulfovibrio sp. A2]
MHPKGCCLSAPFSARAAGLRHSEASPLRTRCASPAFRGFLFSGEEGGPFPRGAYSSVRDPKEKTA